ncbi:MAG TPA: YbhB/YbcL family Raf kinase inhibitor-like protein, partial [Polyangiales bacterium]
WDHLRGAARSFALICEDPDAPFPQPFVHWIVYDIPDDARSIEPVHAWQHGKNSLLQLGYTGAAPPPGHGTHHYHFQLFALDVAHLPARGIGRRAFVSALRGHIVAWGELVARYGRGGGMA